MKTLYYTIIAILVFSTSLYLKPIYGENQDSIMIVNPQATSSIKVGDTFAINATLVNNSTNTITVKNGCGGPFSVTFDGHAKVELKKVCNWMAIQIILHPGENITGSSLASNLSYRAIASGTANTTITFSYVIDNKTSNLSFDNNSTSISKSFLYAISNQSKETTPSISSPLKQFKSGIAAQDVTCNNGLQLVIKSEDNSPACVTPDTASKLVIRGWAKSPENGVLVTLAEGQREGPLLVQQIFSDNIQGLSFREFPLATNVGSPVTLHIGDSISNGCTVELTLVKISHGTATFLKKENLNKICPICLSENTVIDTPNGPVNIKNLKTGMAVLTQDSSGHMQTGTILKTGRTMTPPGHVMVHVVLSDTRELYASQNHPTADGRFFGELQAGDNLDGSKIKSVERVPYNGTFTYDILPSGQTGFYYADKILVASTLK
ncbi:MAG: Hint domain-containing protein [Nitrosotalea sp.]